MIRKILDGLTVFSFLLTLGILSGGFAGYKYVTSPKGIEKIKNSIMPDIKKSLPKLPKSTGFAIPTVK